jgi:hypothetical protein
MGQSTRRPDEKMTGFVMKLEQLDRIKSFCAANDLTFRAFMKRSADLYLLTEQVRGHRG